jgi:hypothetical protein
MVFMIEFTSCEVNKFRAYGGANGCISEYLASDIFAVLGFKSHLESCYVQ